MFKSPTTPDNPVFGILDALRLASHHQGVDLKSFLGGVDTFIHGTTHAINAVITGKTARTFFLVTAGHTDMLVLREGGRLEPFNFTVPFPEPYIPRSLTYSVTERVAADGGVITPLDEAGVIATCEKMHRNGVEAVAVCLLWSVSNPSHELRIGELLQKHLPGVPFTLSHALNPTIREFRRASATAIDASLKPLIGAYLGSLSATLIANGFAGRLLVLTSQGGMIDAAEMATTPIRAINSGPSLAPVAGAYFGAAVDEGADVIVADTGGTTYDVSLVRSGRIPLTRDAWIGAPLRGHLTGFPSVDVKSVGAGGGSIARVDEGGLLHVGPTSAGAMPGPVCYGRGGTEPTLSDACLVLGYVDPDYFLGGAMQLDATASRQAIANKIASPLSLSVEDAAAAILRLATENMVQAIAGITVNQGIDPTRAVLIGGGGAAGLNSVFIARRLGIKRLVIPEVGATLSAAGALMSELAADFRASEFMTTAAFDCTSANTILRRLRRKADAFRAEAGPDLVSSSIEYIIEARYEQQVWEIEVPLPIDNFDSPDDVAVLIEMMHREHERIFAFRDQEAAVEIIGWAVRATCRVHKQAIGRIKLESRERQREHTRLAYFSGEGWLAADVRHFADLGVDERFSGPALIESPFTTVVVDPESYFWRQSNGSLVIDTGVQR